MKLRIWFSASTSTSNRPKILKLFSFTSSLSEYGRFRAVFGGDGGFGRSVNLALNGKQGADTDEYSDNTEGGEHPIRPVGRSESAPEPVFPDFPLPLRFALGCAGLWGGSWWFYRARTNGRRGLG